MKKEITFLLILMFSYLSGCKESESIQISESHSPDLIKNKLSEEELISWHHKDIFNDSIPGISLEKANKELLKGRKNNEIIIAVIDTEIDTNHEDLKEKIWINPKEISNNGIDDDNNGYVDDIHGWNFLGNDKGENVIYSNFEYVRLIRKFASKYRNINEVEIANKEDKDFEIYKKSLAVLEKTLADSKTSLGRFSDYLERLKRKQDSLKAFFSLDTITKETLNSVQTDDTIIEKQRKKVIEYITTGYSEKATTGYIEQIKKRIETSANIEYQERKVIGDIPDDITNTNYGNNNVSSNSEKLYHGTLVSGIIAAKRNNEIGLDGIIDNVKIMPLCISAYGDEHDKDIALAIRYAVDNGAKVINMSSGKSFSMYQEWVNSSLKHAEENDVLFITSAGNNNLNLDSPKVSYYPNDKKETIESFITVGASSYILKDGLKHKTSNYGNQNVDLFAPGNKLYTTMPKNKYRSIGGTSMAASVVSGIAALIRSYFPNLTAPQVKEILMKSGVSYNIDVEITQEDGTKKMVPFSELSKSGKIVNAYNALLLAEKVSKAKN